MIQKWTSREVNLLKKYCGKIPNEELYKMFGNRTKRAVYNKAIVEGFMGENGVIEKEKKIRKKGEKFNAEFKIGDNVKIKILHENTRRRREIKGKIIKIYKNFILIKTKTFKECFLKNDIFSNRVRIEVLKKCS